jgi:hypothetical protein
MQVETYEQEREETLDGKTHEEVDAEAVALIEKLGLTGQAKLLKREAPDGAGLEDTDKLTRFPFREITQAESVVYNTLLPHRVKVEEYDGATIPLRILQVVAYCKQESVFRDLYVLCEDGEPKDPVLVGVKQVGDQSYNTKTFILGRWGAELEAFSVLSKRACQTWRVKYVSALNKGKRTIAGALESPPDDAEILAGKSIPHFYL